jgi:transposase
VARDWRDDRIAEQAATIAEQAATIAEQAATIAAQAATIAAQAATIAELREMVAGLVARVAKLEEQARRSSRNSSQPPSSDGPGAPPARKKGSSGRSPGGQVGHDKHDRPLVPPDKIDKRVVLRPTRCRGCRAVLVGDDSSPRRHQVFELPRVEPIVTEYVLHSRDCACGVRTTATLPAGVPTGAFGPSVVAMVATLMGVYRLSKRAVPDLMRDVFGLSISVGAVIGCQKIASRALVVPVEEAKVFVAEAPIKHADETGWREARRRAWLWTVVTATVTVFMIHTRRNAVAARAILGRAHGVLISDRHGAYNWWPAVRHQFCWAHLIRDFVKIAERRSDSERIGNALLAEAERMFVWWHRVRDGTLARSTFRVYMRLVQRRVESLLDEGAAVPNFKTARTCAKLLKRTDALWTFLYIEGVEPTNNTAERTVRHGVLCRKTSYGTHSEEGSRFIERVLSVHATLRQQRRNVLHFIHDACRAVLDGTPAPSLLPAVGNTVTTSRPAQLAA